MGTGWRRAFCTTISREKQSSTIAADKHNHNQNHKQSRSQSQSQSQSQSRSQSPSPSPRSCAKLGLLSSGGGGGSNPSTPHLRCRTTAPPLQSSSSSSTDSLITPNLHCRTTSNTPKSTSKSPRTLPSSTSSSPRSPFSIFKNTLRLSRNSCGICLQSVKTGQGMAIYTAECSHVFHFPCIVSNVKNQSSLVCPVCNAAWKDVPLLAIHKLQQQPQAQSEEPKPNQTKTTTPKTVNGVVSKLQQSPSFNSKTASSEVRSYDDDEPLVTPTAGGRFGTIVEGNNEIDNEPEEVEEFQGFFVNPISSSSDDSLISSRDSRSVVVNVMPEAALISTGRNHQSYAVVLKVKAPPPPPAQLSGAVKEDRSRRAPIDLVTVLDVSGSMSGAKLQMLKRAMRLVVSSLGSADRLSIVAFSAAPKRMLPLIRMTPQGQRAARRIIDRLACSQGTCVGDALKKATKVLEDRRERNPVASIMLLSDGQDDGVQNNNSNQRQGSSHVSSTRFAHIEIPVHSSSFGEKRGYSLEPAEDAFTKCVGGLLSVVVQDLRLQLGFALGSDPAEISGVYSCNGRPTVLSSGAVRLGDLYAEEEREILVELRVPTSVIGSHHVLSVRCCYKDPATQEVIYGREQALLVPRPQAVRSTAPKIERLRNLFIATRAIAESRRLVEHNDVSSAHHLLSSARALLIQSGSIEANEYIRGLESELTELHWRRQYQQQMEQQQMSQRRRGNEREVTFVDENGEPLTPTSAWRAAERLAKVAVMKKSMNRVSDLHGFENARF